MKRLLAILIAILLVSSAFPNTAFAASGQYASPELQRAVTLDIGAYSENTAVTYKQFFKMLDAAVNVSDSSKLTVWKTKFPNARASTKTMTRQEGMLAVYYAAKTLGEDYCNFNSSISWSVTHKQIGDSCWDKLTMDYPLFPGWDQPTTLLSQWNNHMIAAYFYSFGRQSMYSGKTIFDFDPVSVTMRLKDSFTYQEGLLAALRLHDSNLKPEKRVPTQEDSTFLNQVNARREAILNSKTEVTVTGNSYYVSNMGSDSNDGLSPATAFCMPATE